MRYPNQTIPTPDEWFIEHRPEKWEAATKKWGEVEKWIAQPEACPALRDAMWRWEFLRRSKKFQEDCTAILATRETRIKGAIKKRRSKDLTPEDGLSIRVQDLLAPFSYVWGIGLDGAEGALWATCYWLEAREILTLWIACYSKSEPFRPNKLQDLAPHWFGDDYRQGEAVYPGHLVKITEQPLRGITRDYPNFRNEIEVSIVPPGPERLFRFIKSLSDKGLNINSAKPDNDDEPKILIISFTRPCSPFEELSGEQYTEFTQKLHSAIVETFGQEIPPQNHIPNKRRTQRFPETVERQLATLDRERGQATSEQIELCRRIPHPHQSLNQAEQRIRHIEKTAAARKVALP